MKRIMAQAVKEIAQFRRDKLTVALAFVLPVMAMLLYGYATRLESKNIRVAARNFDSGALSRDYLDTIFANGQLTPAQWRGHDAMGPLDLGAAKATITIPPEFSRKVKQGLSSPVQVIIDATDVNNARVIKNSMLGTTNYFLKSKKLNANKPLIEAKVRLWFNPGREEALYVAPGATAVILWIFPCLLAALAMAREKEQGTILQLYASSISSFELICGKVLAYVIIASLQALLVVGLAVLLFELKIVGDATTYFISLLAFLTCAVLFGIFAGTRASSQSAAVQLVATTGFTTALLLSGFLYPLRNITYPLSLISNIVPARYFVELSRNAFVRGSDGPSQFLLVAALFITALFLLRVATKIMSRMQLSS